MKEIYLLKLKLKYLKERQRRRAKGNKIGGKNNEDREKILIT